MNKWFKIQVVIYGRPLTATALHAWPRLIEQTGSNDQEGNADWISPILHLFVIAASLSPRINCAGRVNCCWNSLIVKWYWSIFMPMDRFYVRLWVCGIMEHILPMYLLLSSPRGTDYKNPQKTLHIYISVCHNSLDLLAQIFLHQSRIEKLCS